MTLQINNPAEELSPEMAPVTVRIERMGTGSEAVGHLPSGKTVFVEGAAPGELVEVAVREEKSSFARAELLQIAEPSDFRVIPECGCGAACGGCPWRHLSYEAQLAAKTDNVRQALIRNAHFDKEAAYELVADCLPSKRQLGYRNKLELNVRNDPDGLSLGFHREGSHDLFVPATCPVAVKAIQKAPKSIRGALRFIQGSDDLGIFRVGVRSSVRTHSTEIALWTKPGAFPRGPVAKTLRSALKTTSIVRVLADPGKARSIKGVEVLDGKGFWEEDLAGARFMTSAPSFFQVNTAQAERLIAEVIDGLGGVKNMLAADLYSGGGTFSIPLAKAGADVIAVESAGSSVRDLRRNADENHVDIDVIGGDAARELPRLGGLDALVVDPPRSGLAASVVGDIAKAAPKRVAYVSCNPQTWARDVARFDDEGYRLVRVTPVDLFPQTSHVEVVSIFECQ